MKRYRQTERQKKIEKDRDRGIKKEKHEKNIKRNTEKEEEK